MEIEFQQKILFSFSSYYLHQLLLKLPYVNNIENSLYNSNTIKYFSGSIGAIHKGRVHLKNQMGREGIQP